MSGGKPDAEFTITPGLAERLVADQHPDLARLPLTEFASGWDDYPWPWSITPWFEGEAADQAYPNAGEAERWAEFLVSLHKPAPAGAPINEVRGLPLTQRETALTPRIGDPATDLASIWAIFDKPGARHLILEIYNADRACVERARGWVVMFAVILLDSGMINSPRHAEMGRIMLRRLIAER